MDSYIFLSSNKHSSPSLVQLKNYAEYQESLKKWEIGDYVLDGKVFHPHWWVYERELYGVGESIRTANFVLAVLIAFLLTFVFMGVLAKVKSPDTLALAQQSTQSKQPEGALIQIDPSKNSSEVFEQSTQSNQSNKEVCRASCPKLSKKRLFYAYRSLLWTFTFLSLLLSIAVYIKEVMKVIVWWNHSNKIELGTNVCWGLALVVFLFILFICGCQRKDILNHDILKPSKALIPGTFCCCCCCTQPPGCCCCSCGRCILRVFPLVAFFLSVGFIAINVIPVTIFFLLYPTRVIAFYGYVAAAVVLLLLVFTAADLMRKLERKKYAVASGTSRENFKHGTYTRDYLAVYLPFVSILFLGLVTVLFIILYRILAENDTTGKTLYRILASLVAPALLLGNIVYTLKKMKNSIQEDPESQESNSIWPLELLESNTVAVENGVTNTTS